MAEEKRGCEGGGDVGGSDIGGSTPGTLGDVAWDVFVSYARQDVGEVQPLVAALRAAGLAVFTDDTAIADFSAISHSIRRELARSRLLLAFYSAAYPRRRACQWELTVAFLAAQQCDGDPRRRIVVVNPEKDANHIHPVELRDARHLPYPHHGGSAGAGPELAELAQRVCTHLVEVSGPFGTAVRHGAPRWTPAPARAGSTRFTGRLVESWQLHSALQPHSLPLVSGRDAASWAVVQGPAGIGKTLLVEEYALRFGSAYPAGVFWFSLPAPSRDSATAAPETATAAIVRHYQRQLVTAAAALSGTPAKNPASASLEWLLDGLARVLGELGGAFLWVVDGLPDLNETELIRQLRAPHPRGHTVFTTRSRRSGTEATSIELGPLPPADAVRLLGATHEEPYAEVATTSAQRLATEVGHHPLAVDLLGRDPQRRAPAALSALLHDPGRDVLGEIAEEVLLPTGYPTEVTWALLADVIEEPAGGPPGLRSARLDVLRCAVACDPVPVTVELVGQILDEALPLSVPHSHARTGITQLHRMRVVQPHGRGTWIVPPLLRWALPRRDPDPERTELLRKAALGVLSARHEARIETGTQPAHLMDTPEARMPQQRTPTPVTDVDRMAAFEIQTELVTRVGIQRLGADSGILREALGSLHTVLELSRDIMRRYNITLSDAWHTRGSEVERLVDELINDVLRPFLERWHPALAEHEAGRPVEMGAYAHERAWSSAAQLRRELDGLHDPLSRIAHDLGEISGSGFGFRNTR